MVNKWNLMVLMHVFWVLTAFQVHCITLTITRIVYSCPRKSKVYFSVTIFFSLCRICHCFSSPSNLSLVCCVYSVNFLRTYRPVGWGWRMYQLHLCWGVIPPPKNECPGYNAKQSDGKAQVLEFGNVEYLFIAITPRSTSCSFSLFYYIAWICIFILNGCPNFLYLFQYSHKHRHQCGL